MKWIKLHSKIIEWEWYKDSNMFRVFLHCLLKANWKDKKFEGLIIRRGSLVTSNKNIAEELGISIQNVRTALKKLEKSKNLTIKTTNKYTVITVNNYRLYQQTNNQLTNNQQSTNNQLTTIEEYKNINNSVCNNTHAHACEESFKCHLGATEKNESCYYCMKKKICCFKESASFTLFHNEGFDEWCDSKDKLYKKWCEERRKNNQSTAKEYFDYDWIDDNEN